MNNNFSTKFSIVLFLFFFFFYSLENRAFSNTNDDFMESLLENLDPKKPEVKYDYDFQSTLKIPVKLKLVSKTESQKDLYEGQILSFCTVSDVVYKRKVIIKANTLFSARIETIITNGMNGIPGSIILGNFESDGIDNRKLSMHYEKYGLDLSLLVFPIKWALTPLPPSGSLTNFIKGTNAKLKQNDIITIYYHPEWK